VREQDLLAAEQVRQLQEQRGATVNLFPLADMRRRDERAAGLHGRLVVKGKGKGRVWGRVNFRGAAARPAYFKLVFADGVVEEGVSHRVLTKGKAYTLQPVKQSAPRGVVVPKPEQVPVV
jgi:hypothetical protein